MKPKEPNQEIEEVTVYVYNGCQFASKQEANRAKLARFVNQNCKLPEPDFPLPPSSFTGGCPPSLPFGGGYIPGGTYWSPSETSLTIATFIEKHFTQIKEILFQ